MASPQVLGHPGPRPLSLALGPWLVARLPLLSVLIGQQSEDSMVDNSQAGSPAPAGPEQLW